MRSRIKDHVFEDAAGVIKWITNKGAVVSYSTSQTWDDLKTNANPVPWHHVVWLAVCNRLTTQDKLLKWYPTKSFKCALCGKIEDSINHLFFECDYSAKVWNDVKQCLLFKGLPANLQVITHKLATYPFRNQIWDVINRLTLATAVYSIWHERNCRIFKDKRRSDKDLVNCIIGGIRLKLASFKVKGTAAMAVAARNWDMDLIGNRLKMKQTSSL
ncbi:uncharacterized protein [Rutidosis leptorrhynchoides]|uniref:uncharacterized protein n=1 Tax=Rutidosis leptorrhynchoides TaxID=125765 RepID=UPI003A9969CA